MPRTRRVLLSVSEPATSCALERRLQRSGFAVTVTSEPADACQRRRSGLDAVILELTLPRPGLQVLRRLRAQSDLPVVVISPNAGELDRARILELGADDFVPSPASPTEVVARVHSVLRRQPSGGEATLTEEAAILTAGPIVFDGRRRRVTVSGREVVLTGMEFKLLGFLVAHAGRALSRDELFEHVWGYTIGDRSTVTVHVRRLREKIEPDPSRPSLVQTVWGYGYCFASDD